MKTKQIDLVSNANFKCKKITPTLKKTLNSFFNQVDCIEGCDLYKGSDLDYNAPYVLIIEESILYNYLAGEYGWDVHTKFYDAFKGSSWHAEPINSCVIGFYRN